ncbi:MAG TPA: Ig-like domain-containing protein [Kofleriaceae bacterium]
MPLILGAALAAIAAAACTDTASSTDLHPEGPPMIVQLRLTEVAMIPGVSTPIERTVFAFGTHPDASDDEQHPVTTAKAVGNKMRIIFDELLRGNNLEEIECRGKVDEDVYAPVPIGATPDDIARCSGAQDVLARTCPGSNRLSVCICQLDAGCPNRTPTLTPKGESVGVLDNDQDGAADHNHFIKGAVTLTCGGEVVLIDQVNSYWTPSGNQEKPAQGGFDALGPAIVLVADGAYPTGSDCGLTFSPDVVDKDGNTVCAPPDGNRAAGCTPGDTSAVKFSTEPLKFSDSSGVIATPPSPTADILILASAPLELASLANIAMTEGAATPYTQFTATLSTSAPLLRTIVIHPTVGLAPSTPYTITVPTTVTDAYHKGPPAPFTLSFTTAAN